MTPGFRLLITIPLLCLLPGCFISRRTQNEPLRQEEVAGFTAGVTTAAEVVATCGAPNEVVQLGKRSAYRYDFVAQKQSGLWLLVVGFLNSDERSDRLWVFFDEENVMTHLGLTLEGDRAEYAMPWEDLHEEEGE
jgi:hypothetical protein